MVIASIEVIIVADLFELDADTLQTVEDGIGTLIHQLGKWCQLVYESGNTVCNNCQFDPVTQRSSGIYNGVGPRPFRGGRCPVCKGSGFLPGTGTTVETVQLLMDWQPKPWQFFNPQDTQVRIPQGMVSTKGFAADLPRILQAKYLIVDYLNAEFQNNRFVRWGEPFLTGNIVKSKFFLCFWTRYQS